MVCDKIRDAILTGHDEPGEYSESVKAHLEGCVRCQSWEKSMAEAGEVLSKLEAPSLPEGFARELSTRAVEEHQRGWTVRFKRTFSSVLGRTADLLLGPGRVPQFSFTSVLLWGVSLAAIALTAVFTSMFSMQISQKSWCYQDSSLTSMEMMNNIFWMPLKTLNLHDHAIYTLASCVSLFSIVAIIFVAFRMLNLRAFFAAIWKRRRIPPMAVILPLIGITVTVVAMNYFMVVLQVVLYNRYSPSFNDAAGPYFLSSSPLPLSMAMFINFLNPLISPALGWNLSVAAFLILMFCSARGVHSMVRFFYGALGSAALFQVIAKAGICNDHYGLFSSIWSYGTSGIMPLKVLSLSILSVVGFSAAAFVLILSLLSFDDSLSLKTLMRKRLVPSMAVILFSCVILTMMISPVIGDIMAVRKEIYAEKALSVKSLPPYSHKENLSTVVALTSDCNRDPDRYMVGRMKPYNFSAGLFDEKCYREMESVLSGPLSPKSYNAIGYVMSSDLAQWNQRSFLEHCYQWFEAHGSERFWGKYNFSETLFYNGIAHDEITKYLDRFSDTSKFYAGEEVKSGLASVRVSLGEKKKEVSLKKGNRHTFYSGPLDGEIKGVMVVNGTPIADTKVRLFTPYNFYYYENKQPCPSEEEFIYELDLSLWNELKMAARNSYNGYFYGSMSTLPLITATTDQQGRFDFSNLAEGNYYLVVRFPGALTRVTQKTPVGIISLSSSRKVVDLGAVKLDVERGK